MTARQVGVAATAAAAIALTIGTTSSTLPDNVPPLEQPIRVTDRAVYVIPFSTVTGAYVYQLFLDGVAAAIVRPTSGKRQGFALPITCDGKTHIVNVRAGDSTARNGQTAGWFPLLVENRQYINVPAAAPGPDRSTVCAT